MNLTFLDIFFENYFCMEIISKYSWINQASMVKKRINLHVFLLYGSTSLVTYLEKTIILDICDVVFFIMSHGPYISFLVCALFSDRYPCSLNNHDPKYLFFKIQASNYMTLIFLCPFTFHNIWVHNIVLTTYDSQLTICIFHNSQ